MSWVVAVITWLCLTSAVFAAYNQSIAISNLFYAYGAYCEGSQLEDWSCKWCANNSDFEVYTVRETWLLAWHLQAFTGYDPVNHQIVVSFRGSQNTENWFDDFSYFQREYPWAAGAYIHDGFYSAWNQLVIHGVQKDYEQLLKAHPGAKTLSTGHSLGAAIAEVAALNFSRTTSNPVEVYTYGCPRVGNLQFAQYFAKQIGVNWRIVNLHDAVPTLPIQTGPGITSPYHHTWTEIWYTSDSPLKYKQCDGSGEDEKCSYLVPSAADHLEYMNIHESCV